ncbi:hypothetical protein AQUCO_00100489v1 [Aquilegia coerulea]|uniref:BURP domain-containing protein n=1 Tax=Aquilegia coerulea TaxID=218851 RepID=A0A2G5FAM1_AQUCA|nr:hypothetical protein AQUCO_00100489v1 [Aquilegia coerulea]
METRLLAMLSVLLLVVVFTHANDEDAKMYWIRMLPNISMPKAIQDSYKDLRVGKEMNLQFPRATKKSKFLVHEVAGKIPISSEALPELLNQFSIKPLTREAEAMKQAVYMCERPAQKNEEKLCATSIESMISFIKSKLGNHVVPMSTELNDTKEVNYIIAGVREIVIFYCHQVHDTKAFKVPLVGKYGANVSTIAVCHMDTSNWNPKHLAFVHHKAKPGVPICHFLTQNDVVWVSAY